MMDKETRVFQFDEWTLRQADEDEPGIIQGYAAVYDVETDLGEFREVVRPGAFKKAIERDDVKALFNHDANYVLGRNKAGTLWFEDDEIGLGVNIVPPATTWATDLITSMQRGDITQMSFAFSVDEQDWQTREGKPLRELKDLTLYDVSVVTYPAYPETSAQARAEARELTVNDQQSMINDQLNRTDGDNGQASEVESDNEAEFSKGQARRLNKAKVKLLKIK